MMNHRYSGSLGAAVLLAAGALTAHATQAQPAGTQETPEALAARSMESASLFPGLGGLCDLSMSFRDVNAGRPTGSAQGQGQAQRQRPSRERPAASATQGQDEDEVEVEGQAPPMRVFDNLYFVGNSSVAAWVLGSETDGYILIDALTSDEAARTTIEGGMRTLGLDPRKIKYLLITHAHGDHYGGHTFVRDTFASELVMSEPDWLVASRLGTHPRFGPAPVRGLSVSDGDRLTVGSTILEIHVTPGHTPGTVSPIFTVYDRGQPYRAALWGGTGFNFGPDLRQMRLYAQSALSYQQIAERENVEVFLSNHPSRDGSLEKMARLADRGAGEPHPFVMGPDLRKAFDVLHYCAAAQAERLARGPEGAAR